MRHYHEMDFVAAGNLAGAHFDLHTVHSFAALKKIPLKLGAVPTIKG